MDLNRTETAEHFNISLSTIDGWKRRGCPFRREGRHVFFDTSAVQAWLAAREINGTGGGLGGATPELIKQRTRLARITADRRQLELEKARGELINRVYARKLWGAVMQNIVNKISIIPAKLPPLVHGLSIPEAKKVVEKMIFEVRSEIANPELKEISKIMSDNEKHVKNPKNKRARRQKK
ncbi:MAG: terminase small subunit [Deltaproteobacteria bacterium]|nr:terminase small subunit [Deltaproteobacteria bacterium]